MILIDANKSWWTKKKPACFLKITAKQQQRVKCKEIIKMCVQTIKKKYFNKKRNLKHNWKKETSTDEFIYVKRTQR